MAAGREKEESETGFYTIKRNQINKTGVGRSGTRDGLQGPRDVGPEVRPHGAEDHHVVAFLRRENLALVQLFKDVHNLEVSPACVPRQVNVELFPRH